MKWQELYREYKGKIDEQFGFMAFHTAPLVSSTAMDAKVVTADMASRMMVWADFGKPNQRERVPSQADKNEYAANDGLYTSGYRLISTAPPPAAARRPNRADVDRSPSPTKLRWSSVERLGAACLQRRYLVRLRHGRLL